MPERPKDDKQTAISRLEALRKERQNETYAPDMPELEGGDHLLTYLFEIGPTMIAGMGSGPITQEEIRCWQCNIGVELEAWEARFIRRLSMDYLAELRRAEKPDCPAPWRANDGEHDVTAVARKMQASIRGMVKL